MTDINEEGLLYSEGRPAENAGKIPLSGWDGLLLALQLWHRYLCARLAKDQGVETLEPEHPGEPGGVTVVKSWGWVPFTYLPIRQPVSLGEGKQRQRRGDRKRGVCAQKRVRGGAGVPTRPERAPPTRFLARGIKDFLAVCNVVRTFKKIRILQIGPPALISGPPSATKGNCWSGFGVELAPCPCPN